MTKKFEDSSFSVEIETQPNCQVTVRVTVAAEVLERFYKQAVKAVNKQISVPGFRKGKAPESTVVTRYSPHIESEWKDILIQEGVHGAFSLSKVYPLKKELSKRPQLLSCERGKSAVFTFSYECYPEVPQIDFTSIKLPVIDCAPITDEQVDGVIQEIRRHHATYETLPAEHVVQDQDYVEVSITNVVTQVQLISNRRLCVESERLVPWLYSALLGMKQDEVKETQTNAEPAETVAITVHTVQKIILPEADNQLAEKAGTPSLEVLKATIRRNLEQEAQQEQRRNQWTSLEDALLTTYYFDIPASMKEAEREARLKRKLAQLKQTESEESIKEKETQLEEEVAKLVDSSLRLHFLKEQIIRQGKIELSRDEINGALTNQLLHHALYQGKELDPRDSEKFLSQVTAALMTKKIQDYALSAVLTN
ncbi:MAG: trigger factor [Verrucomicrobia bacterium]|nr:trigger factor [Verrucomicrobiota bacterium]